jgi:hypothetical protein
MILRSLLLLTGVLTSSTSGADSFALKRVEIIPLPEHQVSFRIDGNEKLRWHFGTQYTRPFFYPFNGPSGASLTRIGHPGAANHDHHRSVWFAHHDVAGEDYWSENGGTQIRQKNWYAYADGDREAIMASRLGWFDPTGEEAMEMDLIAALMPRPGNEHALELQMTLRPRKSAKSVALGKTNFGLLAVRVAKTLTVHFGGGTIRDSEGRAGESEIFGQAARWMDYSGPIAVGSGPARKPATEGITCFDHPDNANHPAKWHVREDGWMGPSICRDTDRAVTHEKPLTFRYLLHAHTGAYDQRRAELLQKAFAKRAGFTIGKGHRRHRQYEVWRTDSGPPKP